MEDDLTSSATMTSVTEDMSDEESDEVTGNDLETSSLITSSDANEEGNSTVIHTPLLHASPEKFKAESDGGDMSTERDSGKEEMSVATDDADINDNALLSGEDPKLPSASRKAERRPPGRSRNGAEGPSQSQSHSTNHAEKDIPFPNFLSSPGNWYEHSCFNHYWRHYQFVSMWCQKHMEVYKTVIQHHTKAMAEEAAAKEAQKKCNNQADTNVFKKPTSSRTIRNRKARRRRKAAKRRMRMAFKNAELAGGCSPLSASSEELHVKEEVDEGEETTESNIEEDAHMEISEEMLDFFAHTHRHRKERDALKKSKKSGKEEKHVNIEEVRGEQKERTVAAPTERPGAKRTSEMRHLYGKGAAMIHGMETALQMTFDRNLDVHQPSLWPNMPFRVIFD